MLDLKKEWSISFAGCGFMSIYYVGAASCVLERFPRFIRDAVRIYGASAGSLMAAILTLGIPLDKCCADLMFMATEARKHRLGPLHPAYNLLQIVEESLQKHLPEDAHVRASGKLCVSLTRVSDGRNLLVSQFDSRDELIQALLCSCFVPLYCGVIPPTYRGVHCVDGAVSDNLPRCQVGNTITISPYAGESDLCPRASTLTFHEVRFNNVSIQVNSENLYRVTSTFFPPEAEAMAEICQNGYMDALRFLQENNLISGERPLRTLDSDSEWRTCCGRMKESSEDREGYGQKERDHGWLDPKLIENLPTHIQKVLCQACRETCNACSLLTQVTEYLPKKVGSYLPFKSARSFAQRVKNWIPDVPRDVSWLFGTDGNKESLKEKLEDINSQPHLRRCSSLPTDLNLWKERVEDMNAVPVFPEAASSCIWSGITSSTTSGLGGPGGANSKPCQDADGGWGLGRAVGWLRNFRPVETSEPK